MDFEDILIEEEWESLEVKQMNRSLVVVEADAGRCGLSNSIEEFLSLVYNYSWG